MKALTPFVPFVPAAPVAPAGPGTATLTGSSHGSQQVFEDGRRADISFALSEFSNPIPNLQAGVNARKHSGQYPNPNLDKFSERER